MMIPIMEFQERSLKGPVMKADDFDLGFSMKVRELVSKYDIKYDPEELICDDATADAVFQAGVELLADIGLLNTDTNRVIKYTKEEIEALAEECYKSPAKADFGKGDDKMTIQFRTGEDTRPPTNYAGMGGVVTEEEFIPCVQSLVQEDCIEGVGIVPGLGKLGNIEPKAGTLSEIYVGMWEQEQLKEALRRVGRPGMNLGLLGTVSTPGATFACIRPGIREPYNTQIGIHVMPEQKLTWDRLLTAHFCLDRGIQPWQSSMSMLGALCRNPQDVAVTLIANGLGQLSYGRGSTVSFFSNHIDGAYGTRQSNWAVGAAMRASERNLRVATGTCIAGIKWRQATGIYQSAAQGVWYTACGFAYTWHSGHTGLEARLVGEIMDCTAGMDRIKANELSLKIIKKAEELLEADGPGETRAPFGETYDMKTVKPLPQFESMVMEIKEDLARMGVPFK
jgi:methylamine--corrinoid protein Co-methyltransferase